MPRKRHAPQPRRANAHGFVSGCLLLAIIVTLSHAQVPTTITPDGTLGTAVTQDGPVFDITGGTRPENGPNLFHSFDRFNVGTGHTARFSGPTGIANVISRVTGGEGSHIDGRVQSTIDGANLYLLNPHGVMFGPNATLDVKGSFHVSTADALRFADGAAFSARLSDKITLTVASPSGFGFIHEQPRPIAIEGSELDVPEGETLSIVGGDIHLIDGILHAPGGRVNIASVASTGEVIFSGTAQEPLLQVESFAELGEITILQSEPPLLPVNGMEGGNVDVNGKGGGTVMIRGGQLVLDRASITADTLGEGDGRVIDVALREALIMRHGGRIQAVTRGKGQAGSIRVEAQSVTISGRDNGNHRSGLFSGSFSRGRAGDIHISATTLEINEGLVQTQARRGGDAGNVRVEVGTMTLTGGGQIDSSTRGAGQGGSVTVHAEGTITIAGRRPGGGGGGGGGGGAGQGRRASGIFSETRGSGKAGNIFVAADTLELDGGRISAFTFAGGDGGDIALQVGYLTLTGRSQIGSRADDRREENNVIGQGGDVTIHAREIELDAESEISAVSQSENLRADVIRDDPNVGKSGTITITVSDTLRIQNDSRITVETTQANAGDIILHGGSLVLLRNTGEITTSVAGGQGNGGDITITSEFVMLQDSQIVATAFEGGGGNIRIAAEEVVLSDPSSMISASSELGIDGEVDVQAPVTNLSEVVTSLPQRFAPVALPPRCAERLPSGQLSSLVLGGRDSVPASPSGVLPGPLYHEPQGLTGTDGPGEPSNDLVTSAAVRLRLDVTGLPQVSGGPGPGLPHAVRVFVCTSSREKGERR